MLAVDEPHWICHSPRQCVLPRSTLLRLQGALHGHCPKWALHFVHFPGLSCSGSWMLYRGTDSDGLCVLCLSQVQPALATGCLASTLSQVDCASYSLPWSWPLGFPGALQDHSPRSAVYLLWGADLRLWHSWQMSPGYQEDMISNWEPAQFGWGCGLWGRDCSNPLPSGSGCRMPASLPLGREGPIWQLSCSPLVFVQPFVLWMRQGSPVRVIAFRGKGIFFPLSLAIPQFGLQSHISSLRLSSGCSGLLLSLRTNDAAPTSMPSPRSLVLNARHWSVPFLRFHL